MYVTLTHSVIVATRNLSRIEIDPEKLIEYVNASSKMDLVIWSQAQKIPYGEFINYVEAPDEWIDLL